MLGNTKYTGILKPLDEEEPSPVHENKHRMRACGDTEIDMTDARRKLGGCERRLRSRVLPPSSSLSRVIPSTYHFGLDYSVLSADANKTSVDKSDVCY